MVIYGLAGQAGGVIRSVISSQVCSTDSSIRSRIRPPVSPSVYLRSALRRWGDGFDHHAASNTSSTCAALRTGLGLV